MLHIQLLSYLDIIFNKAINLCVTFVRLQVPNAGPVVLSLLLNLMNLISYFPAFPDLNWVC